MSNKFQSLPSAGGGGNADMIRSIWLTVDDPGKSGFPNNISARIHPKLHMSMPGVYLPSTKIRSCIYKVIYIS